ncbi:FBP domain-containing protein [Streptomyces sp. SID3343]|uniref:FBP domain-containing protein n=1 Tax=Streptomyces sp. SID3343 TaxID=2690260 RepID=UPI001368B28F|nr:FBP domain-containing protein [Streptomyces sp. SID3343]
MDVIDEKAIRNSFVNCSKGEANKLRLPTDLAEVPWAELDFLGWRDPGAMDRGYLVSERDGGLTGITLRVPPPASRSLTRTNLCSICLTVHAASGVSLLTARRAGTAGREGNTLGVYMCSDLACSLYVRGRKKPAPGGNRLTETLTQEEQIARARANLDAFLDKVLKTAAH